MALAAALTKEAFDKLSAELKAEYVEKTDGPYKGHYFLDVTRTELSDPKSNAKAIFDLEDVSGLRSALQKERNTVSTIQAQLKSFEGMDAEAARNALKKLEELGDNPNASEKHKLELENVKKQLTEKAQQERGVIEKERDAAHNQIKNLLVDQAAMAALSKHKLVEGGVQLLLPHIKNSIRVEKNNNGEFVAKVVDNTGTERLSLRTGSTDPMGVDELVESMSKQAPFQVAFAGSGASGSQGADSGTPKPGRQANNSGGKEGPQGEGIHRKFQSPTARLQAARDAENTKR